MADRRFATSIGASALLHLLLFAAFFLYVTMPHKPKALPTLDVDLSALPLPAARPVPAPPGPQAKAAPAPPAPPAVPMPKQQIVQPPDQGEEKEPVNTNLLSDRNNSVPQEMVRPGDQGSDEKATESRLGRPGGGAQPEAPPQAAPPVAAPAPPVRAKEPARPAPPIPKEKPRSVPAARDAGDDDRKLASLPSLDKLLPNAADMAQQQPLPRATPQSQRNGRDLLNSGGEVFSGRPGTRDYLPHIRQGNVTMLNTKADLFAPFVRRVASRIFENLDLAFSSMRYGHGVGSGRAQATVEAIMDRKGRFVSADLVDQNGVNAVGVDRMLLGAATPDTFFDANPPSGAEAADGKIHFVLLVDLTVDSMSDPRTGRQAVSYYGIAGVGLK